MELVDNILKLDGFFTPTIAIVVLLLGRMLNNSVKFLKNYSIPDPVTGGLIAAILLGFLEAGMGISVELDMSARDTLLVVFFTSIGLNASIKDIRKGGKPLIFLFLVTVGFIFAQNLAGILGAKIFGLPPAVGVIGGSISLIGGHGTTIAWSPVIAERFGVSNAMEIGIAFATLGLVMASIMGGPVGRFLITKYKLKPSKNEQLDVGMDQEKDETSINYINLMNAILVINLAIFIGYFLNVGISEAGLKLPLFSSCLIAGILLNNTIPGRIYKGKHWPSRKPAMALLSDFSLGLFLVISLMDLKVSSLAGMGLPIIIMLTIQTIVALLMVLFIVFPAMGKNYDAAVICSGYGGISMGGTPTAMVNMAAVSQRYGASHMAFIVVPLISAFIIDLANVLIIPFFLNLF